MTPLSLPFSCTNSFGGRLLMIGNAFRHRVLLFPFRGLHDLEGGTHDDDVTDSAGAQALGRSAAVSMAVLPDRRHLRAHHAARLRPRVRDVQFVAERARSRVGERSRRLAPMNAIRGIALLGHQSAGESGDVTLEGGRARFNALQMLNQEGKSLLWRTRRATGSAETRSAASGEKDLTVQARALWPRFFPGTAPTSGRSKASRVAHRGRAGSTPSSGRTADRRLFVGLFEPVHPWR